MSCVEFLSLFEFQQFMFLDSWFNFSAAFVLPFDWTMEQLFDGPGCLRVMHEIVVGEIGPDDMYLRMGDVE